MAKVAWTNFPSDGGHQISPARVPEIGEVYTENGRVFTVWDPIDPPAPARVPIARWDFVKLVRGPGGMSVATMARFGQYDATLGGLLDLWVGLVMEPEVKPSATVSGGLVALEAAGLLSVGGKNAVWAAWPTA